MRTRDAVKIANRIVENLFCEGKLLGGRKAQRLVLELPGENYRGSGWCREAVRDVIVDGLRKKLAWVKGA
jgi:hypothetical protein